MADDAAVRRAGPAGVLQTLRDTPAGGRFALLGAFINQVGAFVQLFLVLYLTDRGLSTEQAGLALGAYAFGAILGTLFGGDITDRLGPRWTIVIATGAAALFTASVTVLHSFLEIAVVVTLSGLMTQAARPAVSALLFNLVSKERQTMVFAMYATAINAGAIVGPLTAAWLSTISWNLVFWFDAATALLYCAVAVFLLPKDRSPRVTAPDGHGSEPTSHGAGYRTLLSDHRYLAYLSLMLANGLVYVQYYVVLPLMLVAAGYHTWAYSTVTAISGSIIVGANMLVTKRTQRWPAWAAVITGWTLLVFGRGMYGLPGGLTVIVGGTMLAATGVVIGGAAAFAYPAKVAPSGALGRYVGSAHAVFQSGYAIGPIVGVLLWTSLGRMFWAICLGFGLAMILPGVWGMRHPDAIPAAQPDTPVASKS